MRIGLLSDTHGHLDEGILGHLAGCDEVWHAGDIGHLDVAERLADGRPLRAVHGNIDGPELRRAFPALLRWTCGGLDVLMLHIGGTPGRRTAEARRALAAGAPGLFITGHSHILKVVRDDAYGCLHLNPGAAGLQGWHKVRTLLRFTVDGGAVSGMEVVELMPRRPSAGLQKPTPTP